MRFTPPRTPITNEEPWRYVLWDEAVDLAAYCAFACVSRSLGLRAATDKTTDTLRWKREFERRFPWCASSESRTLAVARPAMLWNGDRLETCWRATYLRLARAVPTWDERGRLDDAVADLRYDDACQACEVGGADGLAAVDDALVHDGPFTTDEEALGRFVATVLAARRAPFRRNGWCFKDRDADFWRIQFERCVHGLHVPAARAYLRSRRFLASHPFYRAQALSYAAREYLCLMDRAFGIAPPPKIVFLEGQPGVGRPWTLAGLRMSDAATRREQIAVYERWSEMGELLLAAYFHPELRGVLCGNMPNVMTEHVAAARRAAANVEASLDEPDDAAYYEQGMAELWTDHLADIM